MCSRASAWVGPSRSVRTTECDGVGAGVVDGEVVGGSVQIPVGQVAREARAAVGARLGHVVAGGQEGEGPLLVEVVVIIVIILGIIVIIMNLRRHQTHHHHPTTRRSPPPLA
jgi:hypothetical protein